MFNTVLSHDEGFAAAYDKATGAIADYAETRAALPRPTTTRGDPKPRPPANPRSRDRRSRKESSGDQGRPVSVRGPGPKWQGSGAKTLLRPSSRSSSQDGRSARAPPQVLVSGGSSPNRPISGAGGFMGPPAFFLISRSRRSQRTLGHSVWRPTMTVRKPLPFALTFAFSSCSPRRPSRRRPPRAHRASISAGQPSIRATTGHGRCCKASFQSTERPPPPPANAANRHRNAARTNHGPRHGGRHVLPLLPHHHQHPPGRRIGADHDKRHDLDGCGQDRIRRHHDVSADLPASRSARRA